MQLHNLKLQQALVGLNVRQAATAGEPAAFAGRFLRIWRPQGGLNYTQQDAKAIIDRNSAEDNAAYHAPRGKVDPATGRRRDQPAAIRANIPEQGRVLTFKRAVVVDTWADLHIGLEARSAQPATWRVRLVILLALVLALGLLGGAARPLRDCAGMACAGEVTTEFGAGEFQVQIRLGGWLLR